MNTYNQFLKQKDRHLAIKKSVELLTEKREQSCCVGRDYVRNIYDHFVITEDDSKQKEEALAIDPKYILDWEKLHDSYIGYKRPQDLTVCYLCGPEPENDFSEFIGLGILPQNIWAFEHDRSTYQVAVNKTTEKGYPYPRILRQNIENFFMQTPKKFDIIYVDACGSVPSSQNALRCITKICQYQRLNSPGIIITNFCEPDKDDYENYISLIAPYLYFKQESGMQINSSELNDAKIQSIEEEYRDNFSDAYDSFISSILRDIPSLLVPIQRFTENQYFLQLLNLNKCEDIPSSKLFDFAKGMGLPRWAYCFDLVPSMLNARTKLFFSQTVELNKIKQVSNIFALLMEKQLHIPESMRAIEDFQKDINMYQFLDKPHINLLLDTLFNQLTYPLHYVSEQCVSYKYKAKEKWMYTDLTVLDECRYIYEWMPTVDQMAKALSDKSIQYIFRFAMDGLVKQRENYNKEIFFQGAVISGDSEPPFNRKVIPQRINLNYTR